MKLLVPKPSFQYVLELLAVILLIAVIALVFKWVFSVFGELRMLKDYFQEYIEPQPGQVYIWSIIFSALLGTLGALTDNIIAFSAIFALYSAGDIWGQYMRNTQLKAGWRKIRAEGTTDSVLFSKWQAIAYFYLDRPQIERSATIMFFSFVALSLSLVANASQSIKVKGWLEVASYVVIVFNILISELVIWHWRKTRDTVLGEKYSF